MTTTVLNPTYDTYLTSINPDTNQDTTTIIASGESNAVSGAVFRALVKFDFSSIPSNAVVSSATIELYMVTDKSSNTRTKRWFRVKQAWISNQATWNIYATGQGWQTAGCDGANDRESTDIGSLSMSDAETEGAWFSWSLTSSKVQEWISGAFTNNGMGLITDTQSNDSYSFESLEHVGGHDPKLTVVWTVETITRVLRTRRGINLLGRQGRRLVF